LVHDDRFASGRRDHRPVVLTPSEIHNVPAISQ
jgi:hypothetical protein